MGGLKHVASTLRPLAKGLSRALEDNPVASSLCLGCASGCVGDAMAQKAEGLAAFDWRRSLTYVAWTLFVTFVIDLYVYATLFSRWFPHEAADGSKLWRNVAAAIAADLTVSLRIPSWADAATSTVSLNGEPLVEAGAGQVGTFLHVKQPQWKAGDVLAASFGMRPRFAKLNDDRDDYEVVGSLHYGPHLLVGLTDSVALRDRIHEQRLVCAQRSAAGEL